MWLYRERLTNSFRDLTRISHCLRFVDQRALGLEYIGLAPGFAKEVLEVYESWEGKESVPWKVKELMMVLRIEVS